MSEITERINLLLKEKGISKEEFYKKCSITSSAYSQWNTGKTEPKSASIKKIAEFLNVSYQWLRFGIGKKGKPIPVSEDGLSNEAKEIIRLYDLASPELRSAALAVLKSAEAVDRVPGDSAKEK